ncbi:MAG: hypothetical protein ACR2OC_02485 [Solirubrobacterales bacterium]
MAALVSASTLLGALAFTGAAAGQDFTCLGDKVTIAGTQGDDTLSGQTARTSSTASTATTSSMAGAATT